MNEQVLSSAQVAGYLGVSPRWVRFLVKSGRLPGKKIGPTLVISAADMYEFEKKQKGGQQEKK
jgi:excisionase family DNA binding protein